MINPMNNNITLVSCYDTPILSQPGAWAWLCLLLGSHQAAVSVLARANLVWRLHWEKDPLPCLHGCWQLSIPCSCGTENLRFFADSWKEDALSFWSPFTVPCHVRRGLTFFLTRIINLGSQKGAKGKNKYQGVPEIADPRKTSASVHL